VEPANASKSEEVFKSVETTAVMEAEPMQAMEDVEVTGAGDIVEEAKSEE
jgi:hypothetical protein